MYNLGYNFHVVKFTLYNIQFCEFSQVHIVI